MSEQEKEAKIEFPCDYGIKAMGLTTDDFDAVVVGLVRQFVDDIKEGAVSSKQSSSGKFTSVTVDFKATSKQQLDNIYQALTDNQQVKYIL